MDLKIGWAFCNLCVLEICKCYWFKLKLIKIPSFQCLFKFASSKVLVPKDGCRGHPQTPIHLRMHQKHGVMLLLSNQTRLDIFALLTKFKLNKANDNYLRREVTVRVTQLYKIRTMLSLLMVMWGLLLLADVWVCHTNKTDCWIWEKNVKRLLSRQSWLIETMKLALFFPSQSHCTLEVNSI